MTALDRLIAHPRLCEIDRVDVAAPVGDVWRHVRHGDVAGSTVTRALFALRTLIDRASTTDEAPAGVSLDGMSSTAEHPGFQILVDAPPCEVAVGAIGKVWRLAIPFVHVKSVDAFATFTQTGFIRVAWAIRLSPRSATTTHVEIEVRVDATDEVSWRKFRRYFSVIGPGSRFIRRSALRALRERFGSPRTHTNVPTLAGADLLPDAAASATDYADITASPEEIWPWLVQMGCGRAGYYSIDLLDNGGVRSADEIRPELQHVRVGDVLPARPGSAEGFEVRASPRDAARAAPASERPNRGASLRRPFRGVTRSIPVRRYKPTEKRS
jgi:hypothetical protein